MDYPSEIFVSIFTQWNVTSFPSKSIAFHRIFSSLPGTLKLASLYAASSIERASSAETCISNRCIVHCGDATPSAQPTISLGNYGRTISTFITTDLRVKNTCAENLATQQMCNLRKNTYMDKAGFEQTNYDQIQLN